MSIKDGNKKINTNRLLKTLPVSIYCKDMNGVYLDCNDYMANMAGFASPKEVIGKTDYDMPWRGQADALRMVDRAVMTSREAKTLKETGKLSNGLWGIYLTTKKPLYDAEGDIIGIYGLSVDITECKQFSDEVVQKRVSPKQSIFSNIDQIISCMPGYIYWKDKDGVYLGCNNALLDAMGLSSVDEIIGKTDYDLAKVLNWNEKIVNVIRNSDSQVIASGMPKTDIEEPSYYFRSGRIINQLTSKVPLRNEDGHVIGMLGVSVDVTEYSKKGDIILEQVFTCMPGSVYWKDRQGIYKNCNNELAELVGVPKSEIIGKTDHDIAKMLDVSGEMLESIIKIDQEVMDSGVPRLNVEELPFTLTSGKTVVQLSNKVPVRGVNGEIIGIVGISIDIADRKRMEEDLRYAKEQAEVANKAKSEFLANMSHDVKTPLSGIVALSELLVPYTQEEYRGLVQDIFDAGKHLMGFFENCIELSRIEDNHAGAPEEVFNVKNLIDELSRLFRPTIRARGIEIYTNYSGEMPDLFFGKRSHLYRILLNLVGNSIKFTHQGSVTISAEFDKDLNTNIGNLCLRVIDTGIGIPKEKQSVIFERFSRLSPAYEGKYEGSGIGLYIVYKFVLEMGGTIKVESEEGKGSQFIIDLPMQIVSAREKDSQLTVPVITNETRPKFKVSATGKHSQLPLIPNREVGANFEPNVLLVEDNLVAQKGTSLLLNGLGCHVDVASCGEEALKLFQPGKYHLILSDIGLPDIKGYEVSARFRDMEKNTSHRAHILGLSAHAKQDERVLSIEAGMDAVLSKPLLIDQAKLLLSQYVFPAALFPIEKGEPLVREAEPIFDKNLVVIDLPGSDVVLTPEQKNAQKLLDQLMESLGEIRADLEQAYVSGDKERLIRNIHKFHGGLCYTPTPHLLQAVKALEFSLKEEKEEDAESLFQDVLKSMAVLESAYKSMMNKERKVG
jgi:PAS domain S-box-containing protein